MLFQSLKFILFLLLIFLLYWNLPQKARFILLLMAGYFYYAGFGVPYLFLLAGITLLTYAAGRLLTSERSTANPKARKGIFLAAVFLELSILAFFKFPHDSLVLPVGISFYTFQTLAYLIDVYRGKCDCEKHIGYYALSVAFFPILLSGPIERIPGLAAQLKAEKTFSEKDGTDAVRYMLLGYFKKMIIADSLAVYVDSVYGNLSAHTGFSLLLAIVLYSIEIYCDFSGYSDIAIGVARLLGIRLSDNFKMPYLASSIKDFWRRWHISLTSWFRDYVYIPLGGNRVAKVKIYRNIMITFLLSGLWHGTGWTFLIWGGLHGILQIVESIARGRIKINLFLKRVLVFASVSAAWVFFRSPTLSDALYVLGHSLDGILSPGKYLNAGFSSLNMPTTQIFLLLFFILLLVLYDSMAERKKIPLAAIRGKHPGIVNIACYLAMIALLELALFYYCKYGTDSSAFIYFQF